MLGLFFKNCSGDEVDRYTLLLGKTHILKLLKNSDVNEMADRFDELYMDQGNIGHVAAAKIALER